MRIERFLEDLAQGAIQSALDVTEPALVRTTTDPSHGDFQINGLLPLAKRLKRPPRELATPVAARLAMHEAVDSAEVAGPGFVNLRLSRTWVATRLRADLADPRDGVPKTDHAERIVVDFSSPNIAKQMHVGHLRSTILGDAIVRLLRYVGHEVIGDNHLGDWGTQFGLLIVGMRRFGDEARLATDPVGELERVYKLASAAAKDDDEVAAEARSELAKLQAGDPGNRAMWEHFVTATRRALEAVYARLGVTFDEWLGESAYHAMLPGVVDELVRRGIAREDKGAICVFFDGDPELGGKPPFIVRKADGAYLYSTTDIAAIELRRDRFHCERALYVVDARQTLHFKQLFAVAHRLGIEMRLEHIGFGTVLGKDGKPLKTRDGVVVTLASLLDEAEERALERIREEQKKPVPRLRVVEEDIPRLARALGIGAVKYADLRQNRLSDYEFDWSKLISFDGNAGPYLQYAYARTQSIFREGKVDPASFDGSGALDLVRPTEIALGKQLLSFGDAVHEAAETASPHLVTDHIYAIARAFSRFYEECQVLKAPPAERESRLALVALTGRQMRRVLELVGIEPVERM